LRAVRILIQQIAQIRSILASICDCQKHFRIPRTKKFIYEPSTSVYLQILGFLPSALTKLF
jgi:hypothetical protein